MVKTRIFLTVSTLLSGIGSPLFVYAQSNTAPVVIKSDPEKHVEKNDGKKKNAADNVESIAVFGHGSTRQTMSIGRASMQQSVPGTSALKVLNELPGVLYQSADPLVCMNIPVRYSCVASASPSLGLHWMMCLWAISSSITTMDLALHALLFPIILAV